MRSFLQVLGVCATNAFLASPLALTLAFDPAPALAASVSGGTVIRNVATATYINTQLGIVERVFSNEVEATVAQLPALEITGYSDLLLSRGAIDQYHFEIRNTGNMDLRVSPRIDDTQRSDLVTASRLILDGNGNGRIDENEGTLPDGAAFDLARDQILPLIYEFRISKTATANDTLMSQLTASASVTGISAATAQSLAVATSGAGLGRARIVVSGMELLKEQFVAREQDGDTLGYTLRLRNNGEDPVAAYDEIDGQPLTIDGSTVSGILLRDTIPLGTRFAAFGAAGGMVPLVHVAGEADHAYSSVLPSDLAQVDAVAFFHKGDFASGRSSDPGFSVFSDADFGDITIRNTAAVYIPDGTGVSALQSNTTLYDRNSGTAGSLHFEDPATGEDMATVFPGTDARLRLTSGVCNTTDQIDIIDITLRSALTGDAETVLARETSANSGVFLTAPVPLSNQASASRNDGVMATNDGDRIEATAICDGNLLEDTLLVSPGNFVFNSLTGEAVSNIDVALIEAASGREIARTTSDTRGYFGFGDQKPGSYRYALPQLQDWKFPSVRKDFPGTRRSTTGAAFGGAFDHGGGALAQSDIPLDPFYGVPLSLTKSADKERVSTGEFVIYTLTFTNNMDQALTAAEIFDRSPRGAELVKGSARFNGRKMRAPRKDGRDMVFDLGILTPLSSHELTYVLRFTAGAREGRNENSAILSGLQAGTGTLRQSQTARATVRLDNAGGVFARQGTVIGSVFMDCDGNGIRNGADEPGIPGVRIVTQEGLSVVTDIDGKYSLFGLRPVTHAFAVQGSTLPGGTAVTVTRTNDLRRGGSRLVPLKKGEMRAEHFAVEACTAAALDEVSRRRELFSGADLPNSARAADLPLDVARRAVRSSRSEAGIATTTQLTALGMARALDEDAPLAAKAAAQTRRSLESLVRTLDSAPGFLDLEDGQRLSRRTLNVRLKGKADLTLGLWLNGREIGRDRVGEQTSSATRNVQAMEYVAVRLGTGTNKLTLIGKDGFGIERLRKTISVVAPGDPARIEIIAPETAPAAPTSAVPVVVRVLDAKGTPVPASGTITLSARAATWDVTDIRPGKPGIQAYLDNGEATFLLTPPQTSGPDLITVSGSFGKAETRITFTPDLEDRIMIGVIEGAIALGGGDGPVLDAGQFSSFEDTATGLRGELYLKGAIRGDALLTLRYSSDRDTEDRLFRDIRGDEYYPVYGDNSERGVDAQSSGNLYVKVEKGRSYILYGDVAISPESTALKLGGLDRVLTDAKAHWENDRVSITVFAAQTSQTQEVEEFRGRGVSGPYGLKLKGYVEGSERVEILVRDEDGGDIISTTSLRRGTDYLLDYFRDTITFDVPVRQMDAYGNPISVRVTYEVEDGKGDRYWLYGGEVAVAVTDSTTVGARLVHADAPKGSAARERLQSAYIRHEYGPGGAVEAEISRYEDGEGNEGQAYRIGGDYQSETTRFAGEIIVAEEGFAPEGSIARPGSTQVRLSFGHDFDEDSATEVRAEYTANEVSDTELLKVDALYSRQISERLTGEIGLEFRHDVHGDQSYDQTSILLGAGWTPRDRDNTRIQVGLRLPVLGDRSEPAELILSMVSEPEQGWRVYSDVELKFDDDRAVMTRSRLGFEFAFTDWLTGRTDIYDDVGRGENKLNQGLDATWQYDDFTTLSASIEHSRMIETGEDRLTSLALGIKTESADRKWVTDVDFDTTFEETGNTYYGSLGIAGQMTPDLTVLARSRIALDQRNGKDHLRVRTRAGLAYRPLDNPRAELLAWYEHRLEENAHRSETHMWSIDGSYEVDEDLRLNAKYAGQTQSIDLDGGASARSLTQLAQAGLNYEFWDDQFQIGLNATHLWDDAGNSTNGLGVEVGYAVTKGTQIAIGYNAAENRVSGQSDLYQSGFYLRFNLLLDDSLWDQLGGFLRN